MQDKMNTKHFIVTHFMIQDKWYTIDDCWNDQQQITGDAFCLFDVKASCQGGHQLQQQTKVLQAFHELFSQKLVSFL